LEIYPENVCAPNAPEEILTGFATFEFGTVTQEDQNKQDEEKRREAIRDLVESWMDRLQLISVIVSFS